MNKSDCLICQIFSMHVADPGSNPSILCSPLSTIRSVEPGISPKHNWAWPPKQNPTKTKKDYII